MPDFVKYAYEERYRFYQFARPDGKDGLAEGEVISTYEITCLDKITGTPCTSTMISDTAIVGGTQVTYKLKAGEAGKYYLLYIKAVTTLGQKLEGVVEIYVKQ